MIVSTPRPGQTAVIELTLPDAWKGNPSPSDTRVSKRKRTPAKRITTHPLPSNTGHPSPLNTHKVTPSEVSPSEVSPSKGRTPPFSHLSGAERISLEKEYDRIEAKIKQIRDGASHNAWGPMYDDLELEEIRKLKNRKSEITKRLGAVA
jgi:hypothetical protein